MGRVQSGSSPEQMAFGQNPGRYESLWKKCLGLECLIEEPYMRKTFVRFCEGLGNNWCYTPGGPRLLDSIGNIKIFFFSITPLLHYSTTPDIDVSLLSFLKILTPLSFRSIMVAWNLRN